MIEQPSKGKKQVVQSLLTLHDGLKLESLLILQLLNLVPARNNIKKMQIN